MERLDFAGFGGVRLAGDAFGSPQAPPVVLVPSGGETKELWHGSARALAAAGRYAICIDLRGHGHSSHAADGRYDLDAHVQDLRAILAALPSRALVVATGLGAIISLVTVGESAPHLVAGLALVDVNIWFEEVEVKRLHAALLQRTTGAGAAGNIVDALTAVHPGEPAPAGIDRLLSAFATGKDGRLEWRGDHRALASVDIVLQQDRLSVAASRIVAPVTLVRGSLNATISNENLQRLKALIPGAEMVEIEGAGHFLAADREDVFNAIILDFLERHSPREPLSYIGGSEPRVLRDALGCFGTGVTIITTVDQAGEPIGLTANSFTSVSLDPPLILFSLARQSANLGTFAQAGRFAVNVLHIGQQPLANRFAQRGGPRFAGVAWSIRSDQGAPILDGALASFDCLNYAIHEGGDHLIFIGQVHHAWFEPHRDPLFYFRGKYRRLHFT
jgi:flavin reductase (DIM6/NTAB) family NADH-FMN oxidoreductase RutF/pimeloyl-ACP methyl ester carboxylesterase